MIRVAIDGPGGAGKSTIAKLVAARLGLEYIDTGAMYRAVAYKMTKDGILSTDEEGLKTALADTDIDFVDGNIVLDGIIVNDLIRTPEMSSAASEYSAVGVVREKLVQLQRNIGQSKSVIMDGRDIGTNVLKDAEFKFFLTATPEERANRRYMELIEKGQSVSLEAVLADINQRDYNDSHRALNPLAKADDAIEIDSTDLSIDEVVDAIIKEVGC